MRREDMITKCNFYKKNNIAVHFSLLVGNFYNGNLIEVNDNDLVIDDFHLGISIVLYSEIDEKGITPYKKREENGS